MQEVVIRKASTLDYKAIVDINDGEVQHTSPMDMERLGELDRLSAYHKVAEIEGKVVAFLLAMREDCPYSNKNYNWFSSHYNKFFYIDRVVVDSKYFGLKIATMLYQDIFNHARSHGVTVITCEYNMIPPNEPSRIFHNKFGFEEVGTHWVSRGDKKVSLQAAQM